MLRLAAAALAASALSGTAMAQMVVEQTIDFRATDVRATTIVREMYADEFQSIAAEAFWLIPPVSEMPQQIAALLCRQPRMEDCSVTVLFHTGEAWAEVWRRPGKVLQIGVVDETTGLRNLIDDEREWSWDGEQYIPFPRGALPENGTPSRSQLLTAKAYVREQLDIPPEVPLSDLGMTRLSLRGSEGVAINVTGVAACGNGPCPVVFLDGADKPIGYVMSLGPDVRLGAGVDREGYRLVEAATRFGVSVTSPVEKRVHELIKPQQVTRAGEPREEATVELDGAASGAAERPAEAAPLPGSNG